MPRDALEVADDVAHLLAQYPCPNCLVWAKVDSVVEHVKAVRCTSLGFREKWVRV
jgi:hypothetical protein